ncbi:glucoamylase family protein [uncultured Paludibaculum sp.]|uniref:glucoamylase family protein n=1 Tax=uncultured Paludibaculum sp. TaxID=1765020 RepID=UPI002AABDD99|nr:glucoamylase family protein [uncultured Paludibaculum sp.]
MLIEKQTTNDWEEIVRREVAQWTPTKRDRSHRPEKILKQIRAALRDLAHAHVDNAAIRDSSHLLRTALIEAEEAVHGFRRQPHACGDARVLLAAELFDNVQQGVFHEEEFVAFASALIQECDLEMGEIWAFKPALQLVLLHRVAEAAELTAQGGTCPPLDQTIDSLRLLGEAPWKELFESVNPVDAILSRDPAGAYLSMDYESRDQYRRQVAKLATHSATDERAVAEAAIALASEGTGPRQRHCGYYLICEGRSALEQRIAYRAPWTERATAWIRDNPTAVYLCGVEISTFLIVALLLSGLNTMTPLLGGILLTLLPASHAAVHFMNALVSHFAETRALPKLDFSEGIPKDAATLVVVPTLLLNRRQVDALVRDLEVRFLANRGPNLHFGLLTDTPDSSRQVDERDELAGICALLIDELNQRYGHAGGKPFFLLHRQRAFNPSEGKWMGWERKRGKLLDLNRFLRGASDPFPVKTGDMETICQARYVITLDTDTQLPRGAAARLAGTMAHPLHRPEVDPATRIVVAGYGVLQPRVSVCVRSASRSRLASIYSGQTGFDIYTRAVSDVYQDLFGEGIFTGKGIYDIDVFRTVLENRFPCNTLLSHDLIEGIYARAGLASDIEVVDDYPSHFSAYSRRQHRWVRGDWQIMRWLLPIVPDFFGRAIANPIPIISRWKILDNLRRSLIQPATLTLMLAGWFFLPGPALYWTLTSVALFLIPAYTSLLLLPLRLRPAKLAAPLKDAAAAFVRDHLEALLQLTFLVHQSCVSLDAIARSLIRTRITRKRMLEWETAAQAETVRRKRAPADVYLAGTPLLVMIMTCCLVAFAEDALQAAFPILVLWLLSPLVSRWLNSQPASHIKALTTSETAELRGLSLRTWRYFQEFSTADNHYLIPDNVREQGLRAADRISPTNLGLLLNARVAATELGYLSLPRFTQLTRRTLLAMLRMQRHRGHFLNWYDTRTLAAMLPEEVSTVDSGNLAVCLWTLAQACRQWADTPPSSARLRQGILDHIEVLAEEEPRLTAELLRYARTLDVNEQYWPLAELEGLAAPIARRLEFVQSRSAWWAEQLLDRLREARVKPASSTRRLKAIERIANRLVSEMDFKFLYRPRKKVLAIGWDIQTGKLHPSCYDQLASEARMAVFVAIAKNDIPTEAWFHLGRSHTMRHGYRLLLSWSGTMFEYLMPRIWMRHHRDTLLELTCQGVVAVQQKDARLPGSPWGRSETAYGYATDQAEYPYAALGVPTVALNPHCHSAPVVSPYATFLALMVAPRAAFENLRHMRKLGWLSQRGFYEAADYSVQREDILGEYSLVRCWMAHHHGMSLLAATDLLLNHRMQDLFHEDERVQATERLLHERAPRDLEVSRPLSALVAKPAEGEA